MRILNEFASVAVSIGALLVGWTANAAETGGYDCQVRKSLGVLAGSGVKIKLAASPGSFRLEIGDGPIFGDQLNEAPLRRTDAYEPEARAVAVARIGTSLFAKKADRLISRDRRSFSDGDMSLIIADNGEFIAFGPNKIDENLSVAVYAGVCNSVAAD